MFLESVRKILNLPNIDPVDIDPKRYPNYEIYVETITNNRFLEKGINFMYQIFPASIMFYHKFLITACQENELETVKRLNQFLADIYPNFINVREPGTLNSAAHYAASNGYFVCNSLLTKITFEIQHLNLTLYAFLKSILLYLLESHAQIDIQNADGNTPLFSASDTQQRQCAKVNPSHYFTFSR